MNTVINGGEKCLTAFPSEWTHKEVLVEWCNVHFGEGTDEKWWNIRSEYDDPRAWPCQFEFSTNCEKMLIMFILRWI